MTTSSPLSAARGPRYRPGKQVFLVILLCLSLIAAAQVQALDLFKPFSRLFGGSKGEVVWKGPGQFVKIVDQDWDYDHRHPPKNDQPVQLSPGDLALVLNSIYALDPEGGAVVPVFTRDEIRILSEKLSVALGRSQPDQDVVFGVVDNFPKLATPGLRATGCRVFFHAGLLNMIFGDVLQPTDSFSSDTSQYSKPHRAGRRMEPNGREIRVARGPGISYWQGRGMVRQDWVRINTPTVIAAYRGSRPQYQAQPAYETSPQAQSVSGSDADYSVSAENHRLREQLARAKKRMAQEQQNGTSGSYGETPAPAPAPAVSRAAPESPTAGAGVASEQAPPVEGNGLSAENRRLREQLARARKRMAQEQQNNAAAAGTAPAVRSSTGRETRAYGAAVAANGSGSGGASASGGIIQRLTILKTLYVKKLITKAEYDAKRKEILKKF